MASNRGVAYIEPGVVEVQSIDYPKLELWTDLESIRATSDASVNTASS